MEEFLDTSRHYAFTNALKLSQKPPREINPCWASEEERVTEAKTIDPCGQVLPLGTPLFAAARAGAGCLCSCLLINGVDAGKITELKRLTS